jgi:2-polyprenyl-3-methyl-5-hydroxy-6-metoxy-1,4-benzoquinol methylase
MLMAGRLWGERFNITQMKILVVIANYGSKNQAYLRRLIDEYKSMSYDIDIIVLSNVPKELGPEIEVRVGLPTKNPWSLPFTHKRIFAERSKDYDLFIYSEDDILIKQKNIEAFLRVQEILPGNEIAGFLRFEENSTGKTHSLSMPDMHAYYHWLLNSVKSFGEYTFACFSNEHSACYVLTQNQLDLAIASGGFLVPPHEGRYDLLCTAATDPYTQCGFTKVICISHIKDFILHHLPNVYAGKMGIESSELELHINALMESNNNNKVQAKLFPTKTIFNKAIWDKFYFEPCRDDILAVVSTCSRNILSVGCGWGATEAKLVQRGVRVVGIPLDSIISESAKSRGVEVVCPNFDGAKDTLKNENFDCIVFNNVLQHLTNPVKVLAEYGELLEEKGYMVVTVPNFRYLKYFYELFKTKELYKLRKVFDKTHLHFTTTKLITKWFNQSGLKVVKTKYNIKERFRRLAGMSLGLLDKYCAPEILFLIKKS